jgi:hypothetical protein
VRIPFWERTRNKKAKLEALLHCQFAGIRGSDGRLSKARKEESMLARRKFEVEEIRTMEV